MGYERPSTIVSEGGVYSGELRAPTNIAAGNVGSIHDNERAVELGFRGGLVSGLVHNEQFAPIALEIFGQEWFERGSYSMYYPTPTLDGEPVQAFVCDPGEAIVAGTGASMQAEAWCETADGRRVAEGTIALGEPAQVSALRARLERQQHDDPKDLRILCDARPGEALEERSVSAWLDRQLRGRDTMTEPLDWYFGDSPWGGPIASSRGMYRMLRPSLAGVAGPGVQVDGGIEVRFMDGPLFLDREYVLTAETLAVGQTPKTEYLWFESTLHDPVGDRVVAQKLMMCRWMKLSSPLYADL